MAAATNNAGTVSPPAEIVEIAASLTPQAPLMPDQAEQVAARALVAMWEAHPDRTLSSDLATHALADGVAHLRCLCEAIDAGSTQLYSTYLRWTRLVLEWVGRPSDELPLMLEFLAATLRDDASSDNDHVAADVLDAAVAEYPTLTVDHDAFRKLVSRGALPGQMNDPVLALRTWKSDIATLAAAHYFMRFPSVAMAYDMPRIESTIADGIKHIERLSEAFASASERNLIDYVCWVRCVLAEVGVPDAIFLGYCPSFEAAILMVLGRETGQEVVAFWRQAIDASNAEEASPASFINPDSAHGELARQYLDLLLDGKKDKAGTLIVAAADAGTPIKEIYMDVFQVSQYEVGLLWQQNGISVGQEHYCTAATQTVMSLLYPRIFGAPRVDKRLVATCVTDDLHEIGIRMVCDFFEMEGWDTYYLGANAPIDSIIEAVLNNRADVLAVSATIGSHISNVAEVVRQIRSNPATTSLPVIVGGLPFRADPDLWKRIGADGYAENADEAIRIGESLQ